MNVTVKFWMFILFSDTLWRVQGLRIENLAIDGTKNIRIVSNFYLQKRPRHDQKHDQNSDPTDPTRPKILPFFEWATRHDHKNRWSLPTLDPNNLTLLSSHSRRQHSRKVFSLASRRHRPSQRFLRAKVCRNRLRWLQKARLRWLGRSKMLVSHGLRKPLRAQASPLNFHFAEFFFHFLNCSYSSWNFQTLQTPFRIADNFFIKSRYLFIKKHQCRYYLCKIEIKIESANFRINRLLKNELWASCQTVNGRLCFRLSQ